MHATMRGILLAGSLVTMVGITPLGAAPARPREPAKVSVTNTRNVPVVVYLDRNPLDVRIGTVAAHSEATLDLPPYATDEGTVRIVVHPEGGAELSTPDLNVKPGSTIMVEVPTNDTGFVPYTADEVIPNPGPGTTTITVQNHRPDEITVYLERGEFDIRLGTILPDRERTLTVPPNLIREGGIDEIVVHPERGMDLANQDVELKPGAHLLVKVPAR